MNRLPCDLCLAVGGVDRIVVTDNGCRHNDVDDAVLAHRAGTATEAQVLTAMQTSVVAFDREQTIEFIARTKKGLA